MATPDRPRGETLIFTCAGAAYTGQVCNHTGVTLMKEGHGNLFCIAAVAARRPDKLDRTVGASKRIAIDGCEDHCCKAVLEAADLPVDVHVVATELGIDKKPSEPRMIQDSKKVRDAVVNAVAQLPSKRTL